MFFFFCSPLISVFFHKGLLFKENRVRTHYSLTARLFSLHFLLFFSHALFTCNTSTLISKSNKFTCKISATRSDSSPLFSDGTGNVLKSALPVLLIWGSREVEGSPAIKPAVEWTPWNSSNAGRMNQGDFYTLLQWICIHQNYAVSGRHICDLGTNVAMHIHELNMTTKEKQDLPTQILTSSMVSCQKPLLNNNLSFTLTLYNYNCNISALTNTDAAEWRTTQILTWTEHNNSQFWYQCLIWWHFSSYDIKEDLKPELLQFQSLWRACLTKVPVRYCRYTTSKIPLRLV